MKKLIYVLIFLVIFFTTAFGQATWTSQPSGTTNWLYGVYFINTNTGIVVGDNGTILRTTDGGASWIDKSPGINCPLSGVSFTDNNTGIVVGGTGSGGVILRTMDGGTSWSNPLYYGSLLDVSFTDINTGTVVGNDGLIYRTTDGGETWTYQFSGTTDHLFGVCFIDANNGIIVGGYWVDLFPLPIRLTYRTILRTTDGGTTWTRHQTSGEPYLLFDVSFNDTSNGTIVGEYGTILRTTDGGETWISQSSGTTSDLRGVYLSDINTGSVVGSGGTILHTTDGGTTWTSQSSGTTNDLFGVFFTDSNTGIAVGGLGTILRTHSVVEPGSINGTVTDANTGQPIQWVLVTVSGGYVDQVVTDETGFYELQNIPAGEGYTLTTDADGYHDAEKTDITVEPLQTTTVDFVLIPNDIGFRSNPNGWRFSNQQKINDPPYNGDPVMWPEYWWSQFDYSQSPYPPGWAIFNSERFPDWSLFAEVFGEDQCYWDPPPGLIIYRASAIHRWWSLSNPILELFPCPPHWIYWKGSCFGFAISSFLFFDNYLKVSDIFPGYTNTYEIPINDASRKFINRYHVYQHGKNQLAHIKANKSKSPVETLDECIQMCMSETRNDRILSIYNQIKSGAHAVNPYKVEIKKDMNTADIFIYDNENAGRERKIEIDLSDSSWSYECSNGDIWGGKIGLFLMEPISNYFVPPILSNSSPLKDQYLTKSSNEILIEIYNTKNCNISIFDTFGNTIGYSDSVIINNFEDGIPIIPFTGNFHPPIGYYIPDGEYDIHMQNFSDSSVYFSVFTNSAIYRFNRADANSTQTDYLTYGNSLSLRNPDGQTKSIGVEVIAIKPDHERVFMLEDYVQAQNDSVRFAIVDDRDFEVVNFGSDKTYNLKIRSISASGDHHFEYPDVNLSQTASHTISPHWEDFDNQPVQIFADEDLDGTIDDTLTIESHAKNYDFFEAGWYMISLPVTPEDALVSTLFPNAIGEAACNWDAGTGNYETTAVIESSKGYWLAIPDACSHIVTGLPIESYSITFTTPGWYMIGSISHSVDFTDPQDNPDGSIIATFGWNAATQSYYQATTLERGNGYWIAVTQECDLTIGVSSASLPKPIAQADREAFYQRFGSQPPPPPTMNWETGELTTIPKRFVLLQNYPNPFNAATTIKYQLSKGGNVTLQIYDVLGRLVRTLVNMDQAAGYYEVRWDGKDDRGQSVPSGLYFYRIQAGEFQGVKKLLLIK